MIATGAGTELQLLFKCFSYIWCEYLHTLRTVIVVIVHLTLYKTERTDVGEKKCLVELFRTPVLFYHVVHKLRTDLL